MTNLKVKIGYICVSELGDNLFIGGLLVTEQDGSPIEFRYTDSIKATRLHRVIYGAALDVYLKIDVVVKSLFDGVSEKPGLFITDSKLILEINHLFDSPVISIQESGESPLPDLADVTRLENGGILMQIKPSHSSPHISFAGNENDYSIIQPLLSSSGIENSMIKPIKQINSILKEINEISKKKHN